MAVVIGTYTEIYTGGYFEYGGMPEPVEVYIAGWWTGFTGGLMLTNFHIDDSIKQEHVVSGVVQEYLAVDPFA